MPWTSLANWLDPIISIRCLQDLILYLPLWSHFYLLLETYKYVATNRWPSPLVGLWLPPTHTQLLGTKQNILLIVHCRWENWRCAVQVRAMCRHAKCCEHASTMSEICPKKCSSHVVRTFCCNAARYSDSQLAHFALIRPHIWDAACRYLQQLEISISCLISNTSF